MAVLSLPNLLTVFRLVLSPIFIVVFLLHYWWAALGLAIVFEVTDLLDGFLARRYRLVSPLGKLIDPLADSTSRFSVFLAFATAPSVQTDPWPVLLVAAIFYRDAIVAYVRTFAASTGTVLAARFSGKMKAVFQGVGILLFLTCRALADSTPAVAAHLGQVYYGVMVPVAVITLWSCVDYLWANWQTIVSMAAAEAE